MLNVTDFSTAARICKAVVSVRAHFDFTHKARGVGGGMLRDVMTNTMPKVLRKRIYAVASLVGGGFYYGLYALGVREAVAAVSGMLLIFALRLLATVYKWNLPAVRAD